MLEPTATAVSPAADGFLERVFLEARTHRAWRDVPVDEPTLRRLYELARLPPTSLNIQPARITFVKSRAAKERLRPALWPDNVEKTMTAPVTAIVAYDLEFAAHLPKLVPGRPELVARLRDLPAEMRDLVLLQNASLQAGYLILAARALGLDCGPMGGFDRAQVDAAFFADRPWRSLMLVNLGHGDPARLRPREPRLGFEEACRIE
jgi:3-hydroxypropanoate dehydrogenase